MEGQLQMMTTYDYIEALAKIYAIVADCDPFEARRLVHDQSGIAYLTGYALPTIGHRKTMIDNVRRLIDENLAPEKAAKITDERIGHVIDIVMDEFRGPRTVRGQELVYRMTDELRNRIPKKLFDRIMDDMKRNGNCGIWSCCMSCVEELVERWKEDTEDV